LHWRIILRNIASNWTSYLVTALIGFFLTPVILHSLGTTGYGLWTLVISLTGYFGLLDLGIRSSVGRFVARYVALDDENRVNRIVSSALLMLATAGLVGLLLTGIAVRFFFGAFHIEQQYEFPARIAMLMTGLNMCCALPLGVFSAVLVALERFDILSAVTVIGELVRALLVVIALKLGYGLIVLASIALFISVAEYSAMLIFAKLLYRPLKLSVAAIDRAAIKDLFNFGIFRFISIVATQLIFYSDSVVLGVLLGASAITYFSIAGSLVNYGRNIVSVVTDTLYPMATRMDAKQDISGLQQLLFVGTKLALLVCVPICIGFMFLGRHFIALWMGGAYASSAAILLVLTIPQFGAMSQYASTLVLAGMAKHRVLAYLALAEGLANLGLSIVLARKIGLMGVAWGTVIPDLICMSLIVPLYTSRILKVDVGTYLRRAYLGPLSSAIPTAAVAYAFSRVIDRPSWIGFAGEVLAMCGVFASISAFTCFDSDQRSSIIRRVRNLIPGEALVRES
jgi:O-antigen/teichoic acid export membrane protein